MGSSYLKRPEMVVNTKEIVWDILQQWKAVLIAAVIMMLLVGGLKYYKDTSEYESAEASKEAEAQTGISVEQKIEDVLAVFTSRGESELVVDYTKLRNVKLEREY